MPKGGDFSKIAHIEHLTFNFVAKTREDQNTFNYRILLFVGISTIFRKIGKL